MSKYTTLLFDLDNTLLDFTRSEYVCIQKLFNENGLPSDDAAVKRYSEINDMYWKAFERGEIKAEQIYTGRFETFAAEKKIVLNPEALSSGYLKKLSSCVIKMPYCDEILSYCKEKGYTLAVITNGIPSCQRGRIGLSGIDNYISHLFISQEIGDPKPEAAFFDKVFEEIEEKDKSKILVIGDSPTSDIKGAINVGIDSCFVGQHCSQATYTVKNLNELKTIL
ncbi:MAG: YjjG family noncanonical pyrimidine nucleotidase [Acutalibacteraceae bacterium]|nr:YjjG family noncanonical pyrimidine nucleotidase [Acutalibacteraceae bacterium]